MPLSSSVDWEQTGSSSSSTALTSRRQLCLSHLHRSFPATENDDFQGFLCVSLLLPSHLQNIQFKFWKFTVRKLRFLTLGIIISKCFQNWKVKITSQKIRSLIQREKLSGIQWAVESLKKYLEPQAPHTKNINKKTERVESFRCQNRWKYSRLWGLPRNPTKNPNVYSPLGMVK